MNKKSLLLLVLFLVITPHQAARALVIETTRLRPACDASTQVCGLSITIFDEITAADFDEVKQLVDRTRQEAERKHWDIESPVVYLDTRGGSVPAAISIGRFLRKEQAYAEIKFQSVCYSACVLVLAGAVRRNMQGKVGIHRPYFEVPKGEVLPDKYRELFQTMLRELRDYFREMNVNEQLADAMLRTEPEHMRLLNYAELNGYGLTSVDQLRER
jgi:hypothetical protein